MEKFACTFSTSSLNAGHYRTAAVTLPYDVTLEVVIVNKHADSMKFSSPIAPFLAICRSRPSRNILFLQASSPTVSRAVAPPGSGSLRRPQIPLLWLAAKRKFVSPITTTVLANTLRVSKYLFPVRGLKVFWQYYNSRPQCPDDQN